MIAAEILRDALFGNPPSPSTKPSREGVLSAFSYLNGIVDGALSQLLAAFVADNGLVVYEKQAQLFADLSPKANALGVVWNDSAKTGLYAKVGATGSGSWALTGLMLEGQAGPRGPDGKSFLQTAIDSGYVPPGTTEAQLTTKIVGQISAAASASANTAAVEATKATAARMAAEAARDLSLVNATTSDTAKVAVLSAVGNIPSGMILQMQAPSRAILRGFTDMNAGSQAYLGEKGREGTWIWTLGDFSALIAADPDEGLYLKATSVPATQGAWLRVVVGMTYFATWWGINDGFVDTVASIPVDVGPGVGPRSQSRTFTYMSLLLPSGATIHLPAGTMTVVVMVDWGQKAIHVRGVKGLTIMKAAGAARTAGQGIFRFNGSDSDCVGVTFRDLRTTDGQISAAGILYGGGIFPNRQGNPIQNVGHWDCAFYNMTAPSIVYDSSWSRTDPNGMQRTKGVRIYDNVIRGCDQEYQSLYGAEDVWYHDNDVECDYLGVNREFYGLRCGAKNAHIFNNRIIGPVGYPRDDARAFNIKSMIGPLNPPNTTILATSEIHIYNNDVQNWPLFAQIGGHVDRVFIHDNTAINSPLPTKTDRQATFADLEDNVDIGLFVIHDNIIQGYDAPYYLQFGFVRDFRFLRNNFKAAGNRPDNQPGTGYGTVNGTDVAFFQVIGNVIQGPNTGGSVVRFTNTPATFFAQVYDNIGPESFFAVGDVRYPTMVGFSGTSVMGKVQTSPGGPLYDAATAPIPAQIPNGTNGLAAPGTWAALTRDPNPATYP